MSHSLDQLRIKGLEYLKACFGEVAVERAVEQTALLEVEVPAWQFWAGFGGGGRFEGAGGGGAARNMDEIAADAAVVHGLTRSTPAVGVHVLWSLSADGLNGDFEVARKVADLLKAHGLRLGSINPTYFLAGSGDGSLSTRDDSSRERFIEQTVLAARIAVELAGGVVSLWFPDGTNYPGQRGLGEKVRLLADSLAEVWGRTPQPVRDKLDRVLIEYKVFEPGTYSTSVPDWGVSRELTRIFGDKGAVLIDLGHHHHGTNVEQIVATLIAFGVRGGFHFNTRYAADDDHSVEANYELARIFSELVTGGVVLNADPGRNWSLALDQMARAEARIPSVLKSLDALKRSFARALLLDTEALAAARRNPDPLTANVEYERALLHADTAPVVMEAYHRQGLHPCPLAAYRESGVQEKLERERA
ncbi:L-rhamnose isomerase [bacterium]|nr:L-rhamnose isomerase [bacterium]